MSLTTDLKKFLRENKVDAFQLARDFQASHDIVLYAETHVSLEKKARFFAKLINAKHVRYHASEHFHNTKDYGDKVEKYLKGEMSKSGLPTGLKRLTVILDAIKVNVNSRGIVFAGTTAKSGTNQRRHERIHHHFSSSYNLHIKAGRFSKSDKGHFHIGAFHGSRLPQRGSTPTTMQRLISDGLNCGVIRIMVDKSGSSPKKRFVIVAGEYSYVKPVLGGDPFELLPLLREIGGGNSFGIDLQSKRNPFFKIKPAEVTSSRSFPQFYDKLIFIP